MPTYPPYEESSSPSTIVTASLLTTPLPTPSHSSGGKFTVITRVLIPAAPSSVLSIVRDTSTWPKWNTFCPTCIVTPPTNPDNSDLSIPTGNPLWLEKGTFFSLDVYMNGDGLAPKSESRKQGEVVTTLKKIEDGDKRGYVIAWKSNDWSDWSLRAERVMEFVEYEMEDGKMGTAYKNWETFSGLLTSIVKAKYGSTLVERFGDYSRDLQGHFMKKSNEEVVRDKGAEQEQVKVVKLEIANLENAVLDRSCSKCKP